MEELLEQYAKLLTRVDDWFSSCIPQFPDAISCGHGCSSCCRGLFDITLLDAFFLRRGFDKLSEEVRRAVQSCAEKRVSTVSEIWPEFVPPFLLNVRPEEEWPEVLIEDDETPCVLLDTNGLCLVYDYRPLTCRLHGLPLVDVTGEIMDDAWCTLNFTGQNPLVLNGLWFDFAELFRMETLLIGEFNTLVTGLPSAQLDTLIPAALLIP